MPLTSSVVEQMVARFLTAWKKSRLGQKSAMRFKQAQRVIKATNISWGYAHFKFQVRYCTLFTDNITLHRTVYNNTNTNTNIKLARRDNI